MTVLTALLFYTLFLMYIIANKIDFSIGHIIVLLVFFVLWVSILMYRKFKFKFNRKKEFQTNHYIIVISIVLLTVPTLKKLLNPLNKSFILTIAFLIVGGIWMLVSLIYWQNYYYGKKNNIDECYCP